MNERQPQSDGALTKVLGGWRVQGSLPARFRERVWQRIEKADEGGASPRALFGNWLARVFSRPAAVFSYVVVLLLAGLVIGFWQGRANSQRTAAELSGRYVQSMNSYAALH